MRIAAVDDESIQLNDLLHELRELLPDAELAGFSDPVELLEDVRKNGADAAFLDIEMYSMNGIELAQRIKLCRPRCNIIFLTGHSQYAVDAVALRCSGYLLKPVTREAVSRELAGLRYPMAAREEKKLRVQTFGSFEVYAGDEPLKFSRSRSKELLAYLIDRRGARCTTAELAAVLYEEQEDGKAANSLVRHLVADLMAALKSVGAQEAIQKSRNAIAVRTEAVDCDYYRFLQGEPAAMNAYGGEYMANYSWAELTAGYLQRGGDEPAQKK